MNKLTITAEGQDKFQCLARMLNAAQELYGGDEGPKLKVQFKWETVGDSEPHKFPYRCPKCGARFANPEALGDSFSCPNDGATVEYKP